MKKIIRSSISLITFLSICEYCFSQTVTQMTVMVIPYTTEEQDIRNVLDYSPSKRIAVARIKEGFDKRGFQTIDFVAQLKAAKTDLAIMAANAKDAKTLIIQFSGTDLVVEADVMLSQTSSITRVATIPIQCYDASSGFTIGISATGCQSPSNQADTFSLVNRALDGNCLPHFLSSLDSGFGNLRSKGRPLKVNIAPSLNSKYNLLTRVPNSSENLSTTITDWLEDHTVNSNYVIKGNSKLLLDLTDVRIPLLNSKGKNYRVFTFGNELAGYLGTKGINADSEIKNGTVYITIN